MPAESLTQSSGRSVIDSITHCRTEALGTLRCSCDECGRLFDSRTHRWHDCPTAFYVPVRILSKLVKARFYDLIQDTGLLEELPRGAFEKDWNVDSRPVGTGVDKLLSLKPFEFMRRFNAYTRSPNPVLPFAPVVPAQATYSSSLRLPLGVIPDSHSPEETRT